MIFEAVIAISDSKEWFILYRLQFSKAKHWQIQLLLVWCSSGARFSNSWHLCPELTLAVPFHSQLTEHYAFLWSALPSAFAVLSGSYSISSLTRWTPPGLAIGASVLRRRLSSVHHGAFHCAQPTRNANNTLLFWQNHHWDCKHLLMLPC